MTTYEPRCPAKHPDLPYSRCALDERHDGTHRNFTGNEWADAPDLAGGGVTCAAIEKEADIALEAEEKRHAVTMRNCNALQTRAIKAEFARDAARAMAKLWKETTREHIGRAVTALSWSEMCEESVRTQTARAEKAERALADVHERDETVARLEGRLIEAEGQRDWWEAEFWKERTDHVALSRAECHDCIRDAAVIEKTRELTPNDVTDEMATRFVAAFSDTHSTTVSAAIRAGLDAMLTEPQRPEGAEDIAALLEDMPADLIGGPLTTHEARTLADHLAERGVRVTTKETR